MRRTALLSRFCPLAALVAVAAGCSDPADVEYPRLLPLSELTAPADIPVHAADAAADPEAVGAALQARRAAAAARAAGTGGPVTDAQALGGRAAALRDRADALAERPLSGEVSVSVAPAAGAGGAPAPAAAPVDPETAARAEALRERARRMLDDGASSGDLPPCPPGTTDPAVAACLPR